MERNKIICHPKLYIILINYHEGQPSFTQWITLTLSFVKVFSTAITVYLQMPLASGEVQYQNWRNYFFVFIPMFLASVPRLISLVVIAYVLR